MSRNLAAVRIADLSSCGAKSIVGLVLLFCGGCGAADDAARDAKPTGSISGPSRQSNRAQADGTSYASVARMEDFPVFDKPIGRDAFLERLDELDYDELSRTDRPLPRNSIENLNFEPDDATISQRVRVSLSALNAVRRITTASGAIYPMAVLSGRDLQKGGISHLLIDARSFQPRQVALTCDPALDLEIPHYIPHDAETFRKDVLDRIRSEKTVPPDNATQTVEAAHSARQFESQVGTKFGFLDLRGIEDFANSASASQTCLYVIRRETHFSLEPDPKPEFKDWLAEHVEPDMATAWLRDLPVCVDKVYYGKLVVIMALLQSDEERAGAAIDAGLLDDGAKLTTEQQHLLLNGKLRLYVHGGGGGEEGAPVSYEGDGQTAFNAFRRQAVSALSPSKSTEFSRPIGFSVESMEWVPNKLTLMCASHVVFEQSVSRPYDVYIRPLNIRIGQPGYESNHKQGDFHAAVNFGNNIVQSGYIRVTIPDGIREKEAQFDIAKDRIRGPFRAESRSGELAAMLGESDSGPDAKEIVGWPEQFNESDKRKFEDRARKWDENASIINERIHFDLGEILKTGNEVQIDQRRYRSKTITVARDVAPAGRGLKNSFTFEILVPLPGTLSDRKKDRLLRN